MIFEDNTDKNASSGLEVGWHDIQWADCHSQVRKLQARIVKATQEGKRRKVKSLQWLLTHSFSGKAIAVKKVTENTGKTLEFKDSETGSRKRALRGLSRVRGNSQARFLGEGVAVMPLSYPTSTIEFFKGRM